MVPSRESCVSAKVQISISITLCNFGQDGLDTLRFTTPHDSSLPHTKACHMGVVPSRESCVSAKVQISISIALCNFGQDGLDTLRFTTPHDSSLPHTKACHVGVVPSRESCVSAKVQISISITLCNFGQDGLDTLSFTTPHDSSLPHTKACHVGVVPSRESCVSAKVQISISITLCNFGQDGLDTLRFTTPHDSSLPHRKACHMGVVPSRESCVSAKVQISISIALCNFGQDGLDTLRFTTPHDSSLPHTKACHVGVVPSRESCVSAKVQISISITLCNFGQDGLDTLSFTTPHNSSLPHTKACHVGVVPSRESCVSAKVQISISITLCNFGQDGLDTLRFTTPHDSSLPHRKACHMGVVPSRESCVFGKVQISISIALCNFGQDGLDTLSFTTPHDSSLPHRKACHMGVASSGYSTSSNTRTWNVHFPLFDMFMNPEFLEL